MVSNDCATLHGPLTFSLVAYLERQLSRAIQLNPAINDELLSQPPVGADTIDGGNVDDHASILANMLQASTLMKSYEQLMQQYERDHDKKQKLIEQLEKD